MNSDFLSNFINLNPFWAHVLNLLVLVTIIYNLNWIIELLFRSREYLKKMLPIKFYFCTDNPKARVFFGEITFKIIKLKNHCYKKITRVSDLILKELEILANAKAFCRLGSLDFYFNPYLALFASFMMVVVLHGKIFWKFF